MKQVIGICAVLFLIGCSSGSTQASEREVQEIKQLDSLVTDLDLSDKEIQESVKALEEALKDL